MAGVRDKLVRVENLTPTGGSVHFDFEEDDILQVETPPGKHFFSRDKPDIYPIEDVGLGESALEKEDIVFPLPEGWPQIPQLFVRRSWDFSTATSPSVNKATSHLELLQNVIEEWFKENEREIHSRASSRALTKSRATSAASGLAPPHPGILGGPRSLVGGHRQLRFATSSAGAASVKSRLSHVTRSSQGTSDKLSIEGLGFKEEDRIEGESCTSEVLPLPEMIEYDIPYLGAEEVIDEVITLLARLENDRRTSRQNLKKEKERMEMLQDNIDKLAMHRMAEFSESVQREHEACSMDINELNWHVSYRSRIESRIKNKVAIADVLNSRLKEDIRFVRKHCPLVQEKLDLERDAMERIRQAQHDTNDELSVTVDRCTKVETKSEEAYTKADVERIHLEQEVETVRSDLGKINEELSEAKMQFNSYIHQCNDYRQQLQENQQELMVLEVKNENAKVAEEMQHAKVRDLQGKIVEQEFEHRKLVDQNTRLQTALDLQRRVNKQAEQERIIAIKTKADHLRKLTITNDELDMDIEDAISGIEKCDKQRIADEKNLTRMDKEFVRTTEQTKITEDDIAKVKVINNAIREKFEQEELRCAAEDETLRNTCDELRKLVKEEVHSRTVIMARISADSNDLVKNQTETKQKKEKVTKKVEEVDSQVKIVEAKVDRLRSAYEEKSRLMVKLEEATENLKEELNECNRNHETTKSEIMPKHQEISGNLSDTTKHLEHMAWKSEMMRKNIEEMGASFKMMSRSMATTQKTIDKLQDQLDDLNIEIVSGRHLDEEMKTTLKQMTARLQESEQRHKTQKRERNTLFSQHEADLEENLKLNKQEASRYRQLQQEFLLMKDNLLNKYEARVKVETAIKDLKQIWSLQKRMHTALQDYFKLRGMYNKRELNRMESESSQNAVKVGSLKGEMDEALDNISHFLRTQMDGSTARKMAMQKVIREETEEEERLKAKTANMQESRSSSTARSHKSITSITAPLIQVLKTPNSVIEIK